MGNLGYYQIMTTVAKKVGGPIKLAGIILGTGAVLGGGAVAGVSNIKKKVSSELEKKKKIEQAAVVHTVNAEGRSKEGLHFKVGDKFKVLDADGDAGLIEIIGDNNSPYFVSLRFLSAISNYNMI